MNEMMNDTISDTKRAVIFDFGGVLIDWNPWYLYRNIFGSRNEFEQFMVESKFSHWNDRADAGEKFADLMMEISKEVPQWALHFQMFPDLFIESLGNPIEGSLEILTELKQSKVPLYGLTNWSSETFPQARRKFDFLDLFDGILVSGEEKMVKPEPRFFELALNRWNLKPQQAVFVDDKSSNTEAAEKLGIVPIFFKDSKQLRSDLIKLGVLQ